MHVTNVPGLCCDTSDPRRDQSSRRSLKRHGSRYHSVKDTAWLLDLYLLAIALFSGTVFDLTGSKSLDACPVEDAAASR